MKERMPTTAARKLRLDQIRVLTRATDMLRAIATDEFGELLDAPEKDIRPGDLVQIRPEADPIMGGMVVRVTKATPDAIRGYMLRPHRGGSQQAWSTLHYSDVQKAGRLFWPEAEWGMRQY